LVQVKASGARVDRAPFAHSAASAGVGKVIAKIQVGRSKAAPSLICLRMPNLKSTTLTALLQSAGNSCKLQQGASLRLRAFPSRARLRLVTSPVPTDPVQHGQPSPEGLVRARRAVAPWGSRLALAQGQVCFGERGERGLRLLALCRPSAAPSPICLLAVGHEAHRFLDRGLNRGHGKP